MAVKAAGTRGAVLRTEAVADTQAIDDRRAEEPAVRQRPRPLGLRLGQSLLVLTYVSAAAFCVVGFEHNDLLKNSFVSNEIALGHFNVYAYFAALRGLRHLGTPMPPLFYLITAGYLKILMLLHLNPLTGSSQSVYPETLEAGPGLPIDLLLLKLPNIVALLAGVPLIRSLASRTDGDRLVSSSLWLASPVILVGALMQGQNDLFAGLLLGLALWAYRRDNPWWTMLLLGLGAGLKTYVLLLVPVTAILLSGRRVPRALALLLAGVAPFVLSLVPFLGPPLVRRLFFAHDAGTVLASFHVLHRPLDLWPVLYVVVLALAWRFSRRDVEPAQLAAVWLIAGLSLFVASWWLPQWLMWLVPPVALLAARDRRILWIWIALGGLVLANNLFLFAFDMDVAMMWPTFGTHAHPDLIATLPIHAGRERSLGVMIVYTLCFAGFLALALGALPWAFGRRSTEDARAHGSRPQRWQAVFAPLAMIPYVGFMVFQHFS